MMSWVIRILLFMGGIVASWFVTRDSNHYPIISFVSALLLLTIFISIWAFWPTICRFYRNATRKDDNNDIQ